jgi:hypothetical protein
MLQYLCAYPCSNSGTSWRIGMYFILNRPMYEAFGFRTINGTDMAAFQASESIRGSSVPKRIINCIIINLYIMAAL